MRKRSCHESVPAQAAPRATLEVVETKFFYQLLVRLFAGPSIFSRSGVSRKVLREVMKMLTAKALCRVKDKGGASVLASARFVAVDER